MGADLLNRITKPYVVGITIVAIIMIGALVFLDWRFGLAALGLFLILIVAFLVIKRNQRTWVESYLENIENEIEDTIRYTTKNNPLPLCIVDSEGKIVLTNSKFKEIYPNTQILKTEIFPLTGLHRSDFLPDDSDENARITVNDKTYTILPTYLNSDETKSVMLYFIDVTKYEKLKVKYNRERKCIMHIIVDNYDELLSSSPDDKRSIIAANIESTIRLYGKGLEAAITKYNSNRYVFVFDNAYFDEIIKDKFAILDQVRNIETDADFPVSLSIGVGVSGATPQLNDEYAMFALDLALGRGGDQAVVKNGDKVDYYGGKMQIIETRNKGKSRVMAHAFRQLIDQAVQVVVMGHRNPDMDALGSAIGVAKIARNRGKDSYIVVNEYNHSMDDMYAMAEKSEAYSFISTEKAIDILTPNTLLVIVDTHKPSLVEAPELLGKTDKLILIDHHRKTEEFIENATLIFMEPSASSTSELITEILQYMPEKKPITRQEAEMLLAGIIVDTNSFSVKTGARTFEAASWLRMNGADTTVVRQFLQNDVEDFRQRAGIIANAEFLDGGIAIAKSEEKNENAQVVIAQAADELLDIKGIRASFVVGEEEDKTLISGRSLGDLNVQTLMEKFGGGGHLTMAAAQVEMDIDETIVKLKEYIREADSDS